MTTTDLYNHIKESSSLKRNSLCRLYKSMYERASISANPKLMVDLAELATSITDTLEHDQIDELKAFMVNGIITVTPAGSAEPVAKKEVTKISPPPITEQAKSAIDAAVQYARSGFKNCTEEQYQARLAICTPCEFWKPNAMFGAGRCLKCGCSGAKLKLPLSTCPIGKWGTVPVG